MRAGDHRAEPLSPQFPDVPNDGGGGLSHGNGPALSGISRAGRHAARRDGRSWQPPCRKALAVPEVKTQLAVVGGEVATAITAERPAR